MTMMLEDPPAAPDAPPAPPAGFTLDAAPMPRQSAPTAKPAPTPPPGFTLDAAPPPAPTAPAPDVNAALDSGIKELSQAYRDSINQKDHAGFDVSFGPSGFNVRRPDERLTDKRLQDVTYNQIARGEIDPSLSVADKQQIHKALYDAVKDYQDQRTRYHLESGTAEAYQPAADIAYKQAEQWVKDHPEGAVTGFGDALSQGAAAGTQFVGRQFSRNESAAIQEAQANRFLKMARRAEHPTAAGVGGTVGGFVSPESIAAMIATAGVVNPIETGIAEQSAAQLARYGFTRGAASVGSQVLAKGLTLAPKAAGYVGIPQAIQQAAEGQTPTPIENTVKAAPLVLGGEIGGAITGKIAGKLPAALQGPAIIAGGAASGAGVNVAGGMAQTGRLPTAQELAEQGIGGAIVGGVSAAGQETPAESHVQAIQRAYGVDRATAQRIATIDLQHEKAQAGAGAPRPPQVGTSETVARGVEPEKGTQATLAPQATASKPEGTSVESTHEQTRLSPQDAQGRETQAVHGGPTGEESAAAPTDLSGIRTPAEETNQRNLHESGVTAAPTNHTQQELALMSAADVARAARGLGIVPKMKAENITAILRAQESAREKTQSPQETQRQVGEAAKPVAGGEGAAKPVAAVDPRKIQLKPGEKPRGEPKTSTDMLLSHAESEGIVHNPDNPAAEHVNPDAATLGTEKQQGKLAGIQAVSEDAASNETAGMSAQQIADRETRIVSRYGQGKEERLATAIEHYKNSPDTNLRKLAAYADAEGTGAKASKPVEKFNHGDEFDLGNRHFRVQVEEDGSTHFIDTDMDIPYAEGDMKYNAGSLKKAPTMEDAEFVPPAESAESQQRKKLQQKIDEQNAREEQMTPAELMADFANNKPLGAVGSRRFKEQFGSDYDSLRKGLTYRNKKTGEIFTDTGETTGGIASKRILRDSKGKESQIAPHQRADFEFVPKTKTTAGQGSLLGERYEGSNIGSKTSSMFGDTSKGPASELEAQQQRQAAEARAQVDKDQTGMFHGPGAADMGDPMFRSETTGHAGTAEDAPRVIATTVSPVANTAREAINAGKAAGGFVGKLKEFGSAVRDSWKRYSQKSFPALTRAEPQVGEAAGSLISTKETAQYQGEHFASVMSDIAKSHNRKPAEFDRLLGAVLTEDQLRGVRGKFTERGDAGKAAAVKTIIGAPESPFKTEADYKAALENPAVQDALAAHRQFVEPVLESNYRASAKIDPSTDIPARGRDTNSHMSLKAVREEPEAFTAQQLKQGANIKNTLEKHSPLEREATGAADQYELSYSELVKNALEKGTLPAAQARLYKAAVDAGIAVYGKPGEAPTIDGRPTVAFDTMRKTLLVPKEGGTTAIPKNERLYVRDDLSAEFRNALKVDAADKSKALRMVSDVQTQIALASGVEAISHGANHFATLFKVPVEGVHLPTWLANTPGIGKVAGILDSVGTNAFRMLRGDTQVRAEMAELAKVGAAKPIYDFKQSKYNPLRYMSKTIDHLANASRLTLMQSYKMMADKGIIDPSPTALRDFVNQVGQYHKEAQNSLVRFARNSGLGPFATAGATFHSQGIRLLTADPGVRANSLANSAKLRTYVVAQIAGTLAQVAIVNYLRTGKMQPPGTPWGSIYLGTGDDKKPKYLDIAEIIGIKRGLRGVGADSAIEQWRNHATGEQKLDAGGKQAASAAISPYAGPLPTAAITALTGYNVHGVRDVAGRAPPGEYQAVRNLTAAAATANPTVGQMFESRAAGESVGDMALRQLGKFAPRKGRDPDTLPTSEADAYLREVAHNPIAKTADEKAQGQLKGKIVAGLRADHEAGVEALNSAVAEGKLTEAQADKLATQAEVSPMEWRLKHVSVKEAENTFNLMTPQEKKQLGGAIADKIGKSDKPDAEKTAMLARLGLSAPKTLTDKRLQDSLVTQYRASPAQTEPILQKADLTPAQRTQVRERGRMVSEDAYKFYKSGPAEAVAAVEAMGTKKKDSPFRTGPSYVELARRKVLDSTALTPKERSGLLARVNKL